MAHVCFVQGKNQYDVLHRFASELASALHLGGHSTTSFDMSRPDWPRAAVEVLSTPTDLVVSFNGVGTDIRTEQGSIYEGVRVPFVTILVDHPVYHLARLGQATNTLGCACVDAAHAHWLETACGQPEALFLPHGGVPSAGPSRERDIALLFPASYADPETVARGFDQLQPRAAEILRAAADLMLQERAPLERAVPAAQHALGGDPAELPDLLAAAVVADRWVRAERRRTVVNRVAAAGLPLVLAGNGWEQWTPPPGSRCVRLGPVSFAETLDLMQRSDIVLNVLPGFTAGGHERIFSAMLNGALCLTDTNAYLEAELQDGVNAALWADLDGLLSRLDHYLAQPATISAVAREGQALARSRHTWAHRAPDILEFATRIRARLAHEG